LPRKKRPVTSGKKKEEKARACWISLRYRRGNTARFGERKKIIPNALWEEKGKKE